MTSKDSALAASRLRNFAPGTIVRLAGFAMDGQGLDDNEAVPAGTCGQVTLVDSLGTVHVRWDNGITLGLTLRDRFEIVRPPEGLRVFSGDWLQFRNGETVRYRTGFCGELVSESRDGAVFLVTREVADAIVAVEQRLAGAWCGKHVAAGGALREFPVLFFEFDLLIYDPDPRGDAADIEYVRPGEDGRYQISFGWTWVTVNPADCDAIEPSGR